jgi:hypothetical protein
MEEAVEVVAAEGPVSLFALESALDLLSKSFEHEGNLRPLAERIEAS